MIKPAESSELTAENRFTHAVVFVNTQSGRGKSRELLSLIGQVFRDHGMDSEIIQTASKADLAAQAQQQIRTGAQFLFSAGGDGTLQGLVNSAFGHRVVLGVIPAGGGNDFAHALGLPHHPLNALNAALSGKPRAVDLVKVRTGDGRECLYLGGGGVGLDAAAAIYAGELPYRNFPGRMRYIAAAIRAYISYQPRRVQVMFETNGSGQVWRSAVLASVLNTPTFGAGIRLVPAAQIDDGFVEFAYLEELRFGQLLRILPRLAWHGSLNLPGLRTQSIRKLRIEADPPAMFQGDGELLGSTPVEIEVVPRAVRFLAPPTARANPSSCPASALERSLYDCQSSKPAG